ncbi:MAG: hypothetical protein AMXMBFR84_47410 [Candidatus Hydrogenedentota bacterium]
MPYNTRNVKRVRFLILIDELHLIAGRNPLAQQSDQVMDPGATLSKLYCRAVREHRKLGVSIHGADQSVRNVADDAVSLTPIKAIYCTKERSERELLAGAALLSATQTEALAQLEPGYAYVSTPHSPRARLVKMRDFSDIPALLSKPSPEAIREACRDQPWRREADEAITTARLLRLSEGMTAFSTLLIQRTKQVERLLKGKAPSVDMLSRIYDEFEDEFHEFYHDSYERLIGQGNGVSPELLAHRQRLHNEVEQRLQPQALDLLAFLNRIVEHRNELEDLQ